MYKYTPLEWETDYDDNDNTIYETICTVYSDGFYFRIVPVLEEDKVKWKITGDSEITSDCDNERFLSIKDAKDFCESENKEIFNSEVFLG